MSVRDHANASWKGFLLKDLLVVHPGHECLIPVYIADYIRGDYGSGIIMGVPAHDERDAGFAKEHGIDSLRVIGDDGTMMNSMELDSMSTDDAARSITRSSFSRPETQYKLKDWLVSRQRMWGAPIPIIHCHDCGFVPVPDQQLPVRLPDSSLMAQASSLKDIPSWFQCSCPQCGRSARRDTDTLDTFVDSSWYFLRFQNEFSSLDDTSRSLRPVDIYIGGIEHSILHLLYARFVNRFLHKSGCVANPEPFTRLLTQGMVHGRTFIDPDTGEYVRNDHVQVSGSTARHKDTGKTLEIVFEKMSKSKYNGVSPSDVFRDYGADVTRLFVLFKAPPNQVLDWDETAIAGPARWLNRVWALVQSVQDVSVTSESIDQFRIYSSLILVC